MMTSIVPSSQWLRLVAAAAGAIALNFTSSPAQAQIYTYTGGGNGNWALASDWKTGDNPPTGATGGFDFDVNNLTGPGILNNGNNLSGTVTATSIYFNYTAGQTGFSVGGTGFDLNGNITNESGNNTIGSAMTLEEASTWDVEAGNLTTGSQGASSYGITKTGAGTLTLNTALSASAATGGFTDSAGTIYIGYEATGFSAVGTGALSVGSSGTFAGFGDVLGATSISGTLSPGGTAASPSGVAAISFGKALTFNAGSQINLDISGTTAGSLSSTSSTGYDNIQLIGTGANGKLTYNGALTLDLTANPGANTYLLFSFASEAGDLQSITLTGNYSGSLTDVSGIWTGISNGELFTFTDATGDLVTAAAPEPASWMLILGSSLILVGFAPVYRRSVRHGFLR